MLPRPFRVVGHAAGHPRHRDPRARAARRRRRCASRPGSSRCCTRSASARSRSRSAATPPGPDRCMHTIRDVGGGDPRAGRRADPGTVARASAARSAPAGRSPDGPGAATSSRRRRHRAGAAAPGGPRGARRAATEYGRVVLLYGARTPEDVLFADDLDAWAGRRHRRRGHRRQRPADAGAAGSGWSPHSIARAGFDPRHTLALVCGPEVMMRYAAQALARPRRAARADPAVDGAQHEVRRRAVRALPAARAVPLRRRPGARLRPARAR